MKIDNTYIDRLEQLASCLDSENVYWDGTQSLTNDPFGDVRGLNLVLKELIDIFPDDFTIAVDGVVPMSRKMEMSEYLMEFFGLSFEETLHLFCPGRQQPERFGGAKLYDLCCAQDVTDNIHGLLKLNGWTKPQKKK